jgi:hypothetical protein
MGEVSAAGALALDPMLADASDLVDYLHEAEATQQRMGGNGSANGPVAQGGTTAKPSVPTGGIDGPGGPPPPPPPPPPDPGDDPGGDPGGDPGAAPVGMADGAYVRRPTLAMVAERGAPEAVAPVATIQNMVNTAASAGIEHAQAKAAQAAGPSIVVAPVLHNPQFYGAGGLRQFTRQIAQDVTEVAANKAATQGG